MFRKEDFYFLKSFIPRRLQILIRKKLVRRLLPHVKNVWPIDESSCKQPDGWNGWPERKKFALVLTHDVETKAGLDKCNLLMDIEEREGFRSSFGLVVKDYEAPQALLKDMENRGFEIYIHGLYHNMNPFISKKVFYKQSVEINQYLKKFNAVGFRSPSMYHNLELVRDLNIDYDASTFDTDPFEPQPDSVGTIFPFWVKGKERQKGFVELPYTLPQDFLLFILMEQRDINIWKSKIDWIARHGGMALLITHSDYMKFDGTTPSFYQYPAVYYKELLEYLKEEYDKQYWNVLPRDMARFWLNTFSHESKT